MEEKNETPHVWKTREVFSSLSKEHEQNFNYWISNMYKKLEDILNQTESPDWSDLKTKTLVILNVKSLQLSVGVISPEFVKEEVLRSDEFITKLINALMEDINFIESNNCLSDDPNFIFWVLNKYTKDKNNLLLERMTEEDKLRVLKVLESK